MKRKAVLLFIILGFKTVGYSQDFALKTNGLYWATTLRWLLGWRRRNIRLRLDSIPSLEPGGSHWCGIRPPLVQAKS